MLSIRLKVPTPATTPRFNDLIFILNPNSQGGATGKNWSATYEEIKKFLPRQHRIVFTKKADDATKFFCSHWTSLDLEYSF
jgi:hypothetical protein